VLEGFNDLTTTGPEVSREWHPSKNGKLLPTQVTKYSNKRVWWRCQVDPSHEWHVTINSRSLGRGCPSCAKHGFDPAKPAWFYLMERAGEQQIGITGDWQTRKKYHERHGWRPIECLYHESGQKALEVETQLKDWLRNSVGLINGTKENWMTASMEVRSLSELKARSGIDTDLF
jgi:predicted GIY-YIG superfamily endonuclease